MAIHRVVVAILTSAVLALFVSADQKDKDSEAAALQEKAKVLSDIREQGSPPFRLKATFKITKHDGSASEGMYTEFWVSSAQWRKEFVVGDFRRTQVVVGRKRWTLDTAPTEPEGLNNIPSLLDPMGWLSSTTKVDNLHDRTVDGIAMRCFSSETSFGKAESCFDRKSGSLALHVSPIPYEPNVDSTFSYVDYQQFGDRMVATSYKNRNGQKIRSQARLEELTFRPEFDGAVFEPPAGSKVADYCPGRMQVMKIIQRVNAVTPKKGDQTVIVLATIGEDGTPHDLKVSKPNDEDFDRAAIDAVRQWRFKPATCDGDPVEVPFAVQIDFPRQ